MKKFYVIFLLFMCSFVGLDANIIEINNINNAKKVIQIGMFAKKQYLDDCIKKFDTKYDLISQPYRDLHIVYAVNITNDELEVSMDNIQAYYRDAFVNEKVSFPKKSQPKNMSTFLNKDKVTVQIKKEIPQEEVNVEVKKIVNKQPIDLDRLITSFENLPYAIYGRI